MEHCIKERYKIPHARAADLACFRRVRTDGELVGERIMRCTGVMKRDCPLLQLKACQAAMPGLCSVCRSKTGFCS